MAHNVQCELQKGKEVQISWIPPIFAKVGKFLRLKDDNGWKVNKTMTKVEEEHIEPQLWGNKLNKKYRTEK